mgnify:CR=1 FL=1
MLESYGLTYDHMKKNVFVPLVNELHDEESFRGIGEMISGAGKYFLQKFTDRDTVHFGGLSAPSDDRMREYLDIIRPYVQSADLRGVD